MDGLDRVNRNFLWGSSDTVRRIHWVGWDKVTKSKKNGGIGLQSTKGRNVALLSKLNWRFNTEREAIWVQVLKKKYCSGRRSNAHNANALPCSSVWAAMKKGMDTFNRGSRWMVGRDSNLSVWYSNWTLRGSLRQLIQGPLTYEASLLEIKDFLVDTGWDWQKIPFELPHDVKTMIQATPIALTSRGVDKLAWAESPKGTFELKSAYNIAMGFLDAPSFPANWIWTAETLPRIKTFLWMCAHNSIGVKVCLERRGVVQDNLCPICHNGSETILRALHDCLHLKPVWNELGITSMNHGFWRSDLQTWLSFNGKETRSLLNSNPPWKLVFPFAVWSIWKSRNSFFF